MALACVGFTSCGDNDDDLEDTNKKSNVDPEGTVVVNMRNDGKSWETVKIPQGTYTFYNSDGTTGQRTVESSIRIDKSNNFVGSSIASIGAVSGLAKVNSIPSSGWTNSAAVVPGCGYIVKYEWKNVTVRESPYTTKNLVRYARLYVVDYMTSATNDGIIGATVKYQGNWKSEDQ